MSRGVSASGSRHLIALALAAFMSLGLAACDAFVSASTRVQRATRQMEQGNLRAAEIELRNAVKSEPGHRDAHLMLARLLLRVGNPVAGQDELKAAIGAGASAADAAELQAQIYLDSGNGGGLLADLQSGKLVIPEPALPLLRARALLATGRVDEATAAFESVLEKHAGEPEASVGLARALAVSGHSDAALERLAGIDDKSPQAGAALVLRGTILSSRGQMREAVAALTHAREVAWNALAVPEQAQLLGGLVEAHLASGEFKPAQAAQGELHALLPDHPAVRLLGARVALAAGDTVTAIADLQRLVVAYPDFTRARMELGAVQLADGNLLQADTQLEAVVRAAPDDVEARKLLARVRLQLDRPDEAVRALSPAGETDTSDPQLLALLGTAHLQAGDAGLAIKSLEDGVRAQPDVPALKLELATGYIAAGQYQEAITTLESLPASDRSARREALLLAAMTSSRGEQAAQKEVDRMLLSQPGDAQSLRLAAAYFLSRNDTARARALLRQALVVNAKDTRALALLARVEVVGNDLKAAESALRQALALDADPSVRLALARVLYRSGDPIQASAVLGELVHTNPHLPEPHLALAEIQLAARKYPEALAELDRAVAAAPGRPDIVNAAGELLLGYQRYDEALVRLRQATELDPANAASWLDTARAQLALGHDARAGESARKALSLRPDWTPAVGLIVLMEVREKRFDEALARVRQLRSRRPIDSSLTVLEGDVEMAAGRFRQAFSAYSDAQRSKPSWVLAIKSYEALRRAGDGRPETPLVDWITAHPDAGRVRMVLATHYLSSGRDTQATAELEAADRLMPNTAAILNNLAWLYHKQKNDRAEAMGRRAYELDTANPRIGDTYGWILLGRNDVQKALPLLEAAARADAGSEIQYHYAVALVRAGRQGEARAILLKLADAPGDFAERRDVSRLLAELRG